MNNETESDILTLTEVSKMLHLHPNTLRNYDANGTLKALREPLKRPQPQFWMGLPVKYQAPEEFVPTPKYYNATTERVEWIEKDLYGRCVFHTCRPETYIRKRQEQAWKAEMDSWVTVI